MQWSIDWEIIRGPLGPRPVAGRNEVYVGETVSFTLRLSDDAPALLIPYLRRNGSWIIPTALTVSGSSGSGGRVTNPARRVPGDALRFEYEFRYEGEKTIAATGRPEAYDDAARYTMGSTRRSGRTAIPDVNASMELRVLPYVPESATRSGRSSSRDRAVEAVEPELRAEERGREEERRRLERSERRERSRRRSGGSRMGVVHFDFQPHAIRELTIGEYADYLFRLNEAFAATPAFDMNGRREGHTELAYVNYSWRMTTDGDRGIAFYQYISPSAFDRLGRRVAVRNLDEINSELRRETTVRFRNEEWLAVKFPGSTTKVLIQANDLYWEVRTQEVLDLVEGIFTVVDIIDTMVDVFHLATIAHALVSNLVFRAIRQRAGSIGRRELMARAAGRAGTELRREAVEDTTRAAGRAGTGLREEAAEDTARAGSRAGAGGSGTVTETDAARASRATDTGARPGPVERGLAGATDGSTTRAAGSTSVTSQLAEMNAPVFIPPSAPVPTTGAAQGTFRTAREHFNTLRDGFARRLGLRIGAGGQVHHAIELQVLQRYPGAFAASELNDFSNMRGILPERTSTGVMDSRRGLRQLHNSYIRMAWDRQYALINAEISRLGLAPGSQAYRDLVRQRLFESRTYIDQAVGQHFSEYRAQFTWIRGMLPRDAATLPDPDGVVRPRSD